MNVEFELKNYRCFGDAPACFSLKKGITAFVGANNSGKSSILRFFFELRPIFENISSSINNIGAALLGKLPMPQITGIKDSHQLFHKGNDRDVQILIKASDADTVFQQNITITLNHKTHFVKISPSDFNVKQFGDFAYTGDGNIHSRSDMGSYDTTPIKNLFDELQKTLYIGPYRSLGDIATTGKYFDLEIGKSFVETWNRIKTGDKASETDKAVKVEREIQKLFKFKEFQINATADKSSLQVIIDDSSYKIQELGSGLAQFILCFTHASVKSPRYILIDEPETNLHASMQLSFVTTLASYAEDGLLFSSHSLGLSRSTAETIYTIDRKDTLVSTLKKYETGGRLSELVGELNFSSYQELGFSVLLLVEGVTEVKAIQQFFRKLKIEQKILMIPLGGACMINAKCEDELRELKRITENIFALADSEKDSKDAPLQPDRTGFQTACINTGIDVHILERRALENYFTDEAVKNVFGLKSAHLGDYGLPKNDPNWRKSDNWKITQEMKFSDIENTDLGIFLKKIEAACNA